MTTHCIACKQPLIFFGSVYTTKEGKKYRKDVGYCNRHVPYTPITTIIKTEVE